MLAALTLALFVDVLPAQSPVPSAAMQWRHIGPYRAGPATMASVSGTLMSAAMAMQGAEVAPTAGQVAACMTARAQLADVMKRWTALKVTGLAGLNAKLKMAGHAAIVVP
ncbi:MAG: hypothetical protein C0497_09910 [Gemmatimonas sp.]|nr:hypothetical protein [Gemmatimonas sp.]